MNKNLSKNIAKLFIFSIAGGFLASIIFMLFGLVIDEFRFDIAVYAHGFITIFISVVSIGLCVGVVHIIIDIFFKNKKNKMNYSPFLRGFIIGFIITAILVFLLPLFNSNDKELIILYSIMGGFIGGIFDLATTKFIYKS